MAEEKTYPLPSYHFSVSIKDDESNSVAFSEVSGLNIETTVIEYREGTNLDTYKMPGIIKYAKIVLKRGTTATNNKFYEWFKKNNLNTTDRKTVTISLLNEEHKAVVTWNVVDAFPSKVDFGGLNANDNKVLIETLELTFERLEVSRP